MTLNNTVNGLISQFLINPQPKIPYQTENTLVLFNRQFINDFRRECKQNRQIYALEKNGWFIEISFNEYWIDYIHQERYLQLWMAKTPRKSSFKWFWEKEAKNKPFTAETIYQTWNPYPEFNEKSHLNIPTYM